MVVVVVDVVVWSWSLWWMSWCGRGRGGGGVVVVVEVVVCWWWINIYLAIGHRAVFVPLICGLSAIVPVFSCRFWKPPRTGEVLPKFLTYSIIILQSSSSALRSCLHSVASPLPR